MLINKNILSWPSDKDPKIPKIVRGRWEDHSNYTMFEDCVRGPRISPSSDQNSLCAPSLSQRQNVDHDMLVFGSVRVRDGPGIPDILEMGVRWGGSSHDDRCAPGDFIRFGQWNQLDNTFDLVVDPTRWLGRGSSRKIARRTSSYWPFLTKHMNIWSISNHPMVVLNLTSQLLVVNSFGRTSLVCVCLKMVDLCYLIFIVLPSGKFDGANDDEPSYFFGILF